MARFSVFSTPSKQSWSAASLAVLAGLFWKGRVAFAVFRPFVHAFVFGGSRPVLDHEERGRRRRQSGPCRL